MREQRRANFRFKTQRCLFILMLCFSQEPGGSFEIGVWAGWGLGLCISNPLPGKDPAIDPMTIP